MTQLEGSGGDPSLYPDPRLAVYGKGARVVVQFETLDFLGQLLGQFFVQNLTHR